MFTKIWQEAIKCSTSSTKLVFLADPSAKMAALISDLLTYFSFSPATADQIVTKLYTQESSPQYYILYKVSVFRAEVKGV